MGKTDYKWDKVIIDADFALKMNNIRDVDAIEEYIPLLIGTLYIHEYVYDNEILAPKRTKDQIDRLIEHGRAEIVSVAAFEKDHIGKIVYEGTINLLKNANCDTKENGKNWGEIVSVAYAKAKEINYFLTDESGLQDILNEHINNQTAQDIIIIRIKDFILAMRDVGLKRKDAYKLWMASIDKEKVNWAKRIFTDQIWP